MFYKQIYSMQDITNITQIIEYNSNFSDTECRYCNEKCEKNASICKCQGLLCEICFYKELILTKERKNNTLECTVCKTAYIYEPMVDNYYLKYLTCKKMLTLDNNLLCYHDMPIKYKTLIIIYLLIILIYNVWVILHTIKNSDIIIIGFLFIVMDCMSFILTQIIHSKMQIYTYDKFPYFLLSLLIIYTTRAIIIISIIDWNKSILLTKTVIIFGFIWTVVIFLYLVNNFIIKIAFLHNKMLHDGSIIYIKNNSNPCIL